EVAGRNVQTGATLYLDHLSIGMIGLQVDGGLGIQLPTALGDGYYDVSIVNPDGTFATFFNGYRVLLPIVRTRDEVAPTPGHAVGSQQNATLPTSHPYGLKQQYLQTALTLALTQGTAYSSLAVSALPDGGVAAGTDIQIGPASGPQQAV